MKLMKGIFVFALICLVQTTLAQSRTDKKDVKPELTCTSKVSGEVLSDMVSECKEKMHAQVEVELNAAMSYLAMGAHFSRDTVNRPGFADMFFDSAKEERDHAIKIISYLLMRGELTEHVKDLIKNPEPDIAWEKEKHPGLNALKHALELEKKVTKSIRGIIETCESAKNETTKKPAQDKEEKTYNDYHLVDYLTADFLDEQYKGQREIAGRIETLYKLTQGYGYEIGEFLFDKKLLNGEPL